MELLTQIISHLPVTAALFFVIAAGYFIGSIKLGPIQLGGVCGTLIMAILVGQIGFNIDPMVKDVFFAIFIFSLGYAGGPQFFANLNAKGLKLGLLSIIEVVTVLCMILTYVHIFKFDPGTASGIVAGSATESAVLGTASEAIARIPGASQADIQALQSNVVTAYSVTYLFGLITIVLFTSQLAPLIMKINLRKNAQQVWEQMGGKLLSENADDQPIAPEIIGRIFVATKGAGQSVAGLNKQMHKSARIERIARNGQTLEFSPSFILDSGDHVLVVGHRQEMLELDDILGEEIPDMDNLNMAVEKEMYQLNNRRLAGITLEKFELAVTGCGLYEEVYVSAVDRDGHFLPLIAQLELQKGDVLYLRGTAKAVAELGRLIGKRIDRSDKTNFVFMGIGLLVGILIGQITVPIGPIDFTLGTGGGALLSGLLFGWWQSRHQSISGIPAAASTFAKDLGLAAFVACVGLSTGPHALPLIKQYGIVLPAVGVSMVLVPACISLFVGSKLLKIAFPILLGGIAGQQCSTPAISSIQSAAGNSLPLIGYTITYAISNVLLPLLGPVVVGLAPFFI